MSRVTFKTALLNCGKKTGLTDADRAHLERWMAEAEDPIWEKLAAVIDAHCELPPVNDYPFSPVIDRAIKAQRHAENLDPDLIRKHYQEWQEEVRAERAEHLAFADKMKEIIENHTKFGITQPPRPDGQPTEWEIQKRNALEWLKREEIKVRRRAQSPIEDVPASWEKIPVRISRQSGGTGKRRQSRELSYFATTMVNEIHRWCGKPLYNVVAAIANIAFPNADVVAEDIRSLCRPSTRRARRSKTGAHGP